MMPYVTYEELEEEYNRMFQTKHKEIARYISFSELMRLKEDLLRIFL